MNQSNYEFSQESIDILNTCHIDLQTLFYTIIKSFDCKPTCGFRNEKNQNLAYLTGKSKLKWPDGKHNQQPSWAIDIYPFPIDFKDTNRIIFFAGFVMGTASNLLKQNKISHSIRWGGNWNQDNNLKDNLFNDLGHFELIL